MKSECDVSGAIVLAAFKEQAERTTSTQLARSRGEHIASKWTWERLNLPKLNEIRLPFLFFTRLYSGRQKLHRIKSHRDAMMKPFLRRLDRSSCLHLKWIVVKRDKRRQFSDKNPKPDIRKFTKQKSWHLLVSLLYLFLSSLSWPHIPFHNFTISNCAMKTGFQQLAGVALFLASLR